MQEDEGHLSSSDVGEYVVQVISVSEHKFDTNEEGK